jgi:hypothetical protein
LYNEKEIDGTMDFIMCHTRKKGFDGKEYFKRKTTASRWKIIETFRPWNTQNGKYSGKKKEKKS